MLLFYRQQGTTRSLAVALEQAPGTAREYLAGYAEGLIAARVARQVGA